MRNWQKIKEWYTKNGIVPKWPQQMHKKKEISLMKIIGCFEYSQNEAFNGYFLIKYEYDTHAKQITQFWHRIL